MQHIVKISNIIIFFSLAFVFASFVEYWVHRLMHFAPKTIGKRHCEHHKKNVGQGFWKEFLDYLKGSFILMCVVFPFSWQLGWAWFMGGLSYAVFAAYGHQIQHEDPSKCFWLKMPVHYVHHSYNQWYHNFGLAVDWWDIIFKTYQPLEWENIEKTSKA
jgi:sterol desaturase/sphingolipid hydroxylase (fatty acid hydroxylase superfamily)